MQNFRISSGNKSHKVFACDLRAVNGVTLVRALIQVGEMHHWSQLEKRMGEPGPGSGGRKEPSCGSATCLKYTLCVYNFIFLVNLISSSLPCPVVFNIKSNIQWLLSFIFRGEKGHFYVYSPPVPDSGLKLNSFRWNPPPRQTSNSSPDSTNTLHALVWRKRLDQSHLVIHLWWFYKKMSQSENSLNDGSFTQITHWFAICTLCLYHVMSRCTFGRQVCQNEGERHDKSQIPTQWRSHLNSTIMRQPTTKTIGPNFFGRISYLRVEICNNNKNVKFANMDVWSVPPYVSTAVANCNNCQHHHHHHHKGFSTETGKIVKIPQKGETGVFQNPTKVLLPKGRSSDLTYTIQSICYSAIKINDNQYPKKRLHFR